MNLTDMMSKMRALYYSSRDSKSAEFFGSHPIRAYSSKPRMSTERESSCSSLNTRWCPEFGLFWVSISPVVNTPETRSGINEPGRKRHIRSRTGPIWAFPDYTLHRLPLFTAATVQIPFEILLNRFSGPPSTDITTTQVTFEENGISSKAFQLSPVGANIHVLTTCTTTRVANPGTGLPCMPFVTHADGSMGLWPRNQLV